MTTASMRDALRAFAKATRRLIEAHEQGLELESEIDWLGEVLIEARREFGEDLDAD